MRTAWIVCTKWKQKNIQLTGILTTEKEAISRLSQGKLARILRYRGQANIVAQAAVVDNILTLADFIQNA